MYVYMHFFLCISGLFIICVVIMAIGGLCGTLFIFFISVIESICPLLPFFLKRCQEGERGRERETDSWGAEKKALQTATRKKMKKKDRHSCRFCRVMKVMSIDIKATAGE